MKTNTWLSMAMAVVLMIGSLTGAVHGTSVQNTKKNQMDWINGNIFATGYAEIREPGGIAQARSEAYDLAARELSKILNDIQIDDQSIYEQTSGLIQMTLMVTNPEDEFINIYINGQMRPHIVQELKMPIYGPRGLVTFLSEQFKGQPESRPARPRYDVPVEPAGQSYTGLILDCRGLGVVPCLHPLILVEDQFKMIYGPDSIKSRDIYMNGVVLYADTPARARGNERAGNNPLVVKAVSANGQTPTNVVVTVADAKKIMSADLDTQILSRANVIFAVGDN